MQKETLVREAALTLGEFTLTPLVRMQITYMGDKGRYAYYASKQPVYLLISSQKGTKVLTPDGREVTIDSIEAWPGQ